MGIEKQGQPDHKFQFQGQEKQVELGLNWVQFKWRNHQPDIGRFFNVDPLAEKFYYNSPYAFSENKVTSHIELEGLEAVPYILQKYIEFKIKTANSKANLSGATTRLLTGTSGDVPQEAGMTSSQQRFLKASGTIGDLATVAKEAENISLEAGITGAEVVQDLGDGLETGGIVTGQLEVAGAGAILSKGGKAVEMTLKSRKGEVTLGDLGYELGKEVITGPVGKKLEKLEGAGGMNRTARSALEGIMKAWENLADFIKESTEDK